MQMALQQELFIDEQLLKLQLQAYDSLTTLDEQIIEIANHIKTNGNPIYQNLASFVANGKVFKQVLFGGLEGRDAELVERFNRNKHQPGSDNKAIREEKQKINIKIDTL